MAFDDMLVNTIEFYPLVRNRFGQDRDRTLDPAGDYYTTPAATFAAAVNPRPAAAEYDPDAGRVTAEVEYTVYLSPADVAAAGVAGFTQLDKFVWTDSNNRVLLVKRDVNDAGRGVGTLVTCRERA